MISLSIWLKDSTAHLGIKEYNRWQFPGIVTNSSGVIGQVICLIKLKKSSVLSLVKLRGFLQEHCNGFAQYYFLYHCRKVLEGSAKMGWCQCRHCTHSPFALSSQIRKLQHGLSKSLHTPQLLMSLISYSLKRYLSWICRSLIFFAQKVL